MSRPVRKTIRTVMLLFVVGLIAFGCNLPTLETTGFPTASPLTNEQATPIFNLSGSDEIQPQPASDFIPTPDSPHNLPPLRTEMVTYTVQYGDTLQSIAARHSVGMHTILEANPIDNPDSIEVGQVLTIPAPQPVGTAPDYKILPDSELVLGPSTSDFDIEQFILEKGGYLTTYSEYVDNSTIGSAEIIRRVALDYSINPRLLIALIEYQSGWVTQSAIPAGTQDYPLGTHFDWLKGLNTSLRWAANQMNYGYYAWRVNALNVWIIDNEDVVLISPTINSGTAGIQYVMSLLHPYPEWQLAVSPEGFSMTWSNLFGNPFAIAYEPMLPIGLTQPTMQLPFEVGIPWSFTGGPHGSWGSGSGWGALDFAPPSDAPGCIPSNHWVVAMADGLVVRSERGEVVQDLDGDGLEQTGWSILYLHIETRDRVTLGTYLVAGDRVGHPSCEGGGSSSGTHVHIARRYNGVWIPADGNLPFIMDGWVSYGTGTIYDGFLRKDDQIVEAWNGARQANQIQR